MGFWSGLKKLFWLWEDWFVLSLMFKVLIFLDGETHHLQSNEKAEENMYFTFVLNF